jgi:hypothetical protein
MCRNARVDDSTAFSRAGRTDSDSRPGPCRELTAADVAAAIVLMGGWLVVLVAALLFAHSRGLSQLSWLMLGMLRGSALVVVVVLVAGFAVLVKL